MDGIAAFPYNYDFEIIMRYRDLLERYALETVFSYEEDSGFLNHCKRSYKDIDFSKDIEELEKAKKLLLLDDTGDFLLHAYKDIIAKANTLKKDVLVSRRLEAQLKEQGIRISKTEKLKNEYSVTCEYDTNKLFDIPVPVIAVLGLGEHCSKFEVQLLFKKVLSNMGYNAVYLCTNVLGSLFGMFTLPEFLFDNKETFEEKTIRFNHYVYNLYKTILPDVIVIGMPGGIMPLGNKQHNYFGEIPLIISNSLSVDIGILNSYFPHRIDQEYLTRLHAYCFYKYNIPIEAFCIARQKLEFNMETDEYEFFYLNSLFLSKYYPNCSGLNDLVINLTKEYEVENTIKELVLSLSENLDAI